MHIYCTSLCKGMDSIAFCNRSSSSRFAISRRSFIFRNQFFLTHVDLNGIKNICIFIVRLYVKAWIRSPFATEAPLQDLQFLGDLLSSEINFFLLTLILME